MANRKIQRTSFVRGEDGVVVPRHRIVFEKLEDDCFRRVVVYWSKDDREWRPSISEAAYFDGKEVNIVGNLMMPHIGVDKYFEYCCKYSGFTEMNPEEDILDTTDVFARLEKINASLE